MHARTGDNSTSRRAFARAHELRTACSGAHTPLLAAAENHTLTQRETHVAQLAASGLTNHQIAERLVVSVRTVESHLYHAFDKLGVNNRTELQTTLTDKHAQRPSEQHQPIARQ